MKDITHRATILLLLASASSAFAQTVVDGTITASTTISADANNQLDQANADSGWFSYESGTPAFAWVATALGAERADVNRNSARGLAQINSASSNAFAAGSYELEFDYASPGTGTLTYQLYTWDQISTATTFGSGQTINLLNTNVPSSGANWAVTELVNDTLDLSVTSSGSVAASLSLPSALDSDGFWGIRIYSENSGFDFPSVNNVAITAIPEPSAGALIAGLCVMGGCLIRRRRR